MAAVCIAASGTIWAADKAKDDEKMLLADGRFEMAVPEKWNSKEPKVNII